MDAPCKNCLDRRRNCHSCCEKYKEFSKQCEEQRERLRSENTAISFEIQRRIAMKERKRKRH